MTALLSTVLFVIVLGLTGWENQKSPPKEEKQEEPLHQTVSVPKAKRQYVKGYYRDLAA